MMYTFVISFVIFSALAASSDATFCLCNSGLGDIVLQKTIDYACRNGADCSEISQSGNCYNPNTLQDHCNYVVNSLYHKKFHLGTTCNFQGAAALSQNMTNAMLGACVYQSTPSADGGNTTTPGGGQGTTISGRSLAPPAGTTLGGGQGTTIPGRSLCPPVGTNPSGGQGTTIPGGSPGPAAGTNPSGGQATTIPGGSLGPTAHMIYTGVNDKSASCVTLISSIMLVSAPFFQFLVMSWVI